jgi:antitoxin HigA-1
MRACGEILNEEFLKPLGLTANALAKAIGVPPNRITAILKDERTITGEGEVIWQLRLGRWLGKWYFICHESYY